MNAKRAGLSAVIFAVVLAVAAIATTDEEVSCLNLPPGCVPGDVPWADQPDPALVIEGYVPGK